MIKKIVRRLVLFIPPMRRFYDFAMYHSHMNVEHQAHIIELNDRTVEAEARYASERARAESAEAELAAAKADVEAAKADVEAGRVQLYVLRSDLQRSAARNERLSHELHRAEQAAADASAERLPLETVVRVIDELRLDVRLSEARVGARISSLLGGRMSAHEPGRLPAAAILDAFEFFVASQVPRGTGGYLSAADQHVRIRMLRSLAARARLTDGGGRFVSFLDSPLDIVLVHAAIAAAGDSVVAHSVAPSSATSDVEGWRSSICSALEGLGIDGVSIAQPGEQEVTLAEMVCVSLDQLVDAERRLSRAHAAAAKGGLVVVLVPRGHGLVERIVELLPDVSLADIEDAGCVLYWRKHR